MDEPGSWEGRRRGGPRVPQANNIDDSKLVVADGSGLSRENRVTARIQSDLLALMSKHQEAAAFRESLAVGGKDGTIGKRMKDLAGRVFAKTGYIGGVRSLSGYVPSTNSGHQWLVFSIIYNKIDGKREAL